MTRKTPPATERRFNNAWGELDYLCRKVDYWLYARQQRARAKRYAGRLEQTLLHLPKTEYAIVRQEALALLNELQGDIVQSIAHREEEIKLMQRLHSDAESRHYTQRTKSYMLGGRDVAALQKRRGILVMLLAKQAAAPACDQARTRPRSDDQARRSRRRA